MAEEVFKGTRQVWRIEKHFENIDLDEIILEIFENGTNEKLVDLSWNAKDFFKQMTDLQYEYGR